MRFDEEASAASRAAERARFFPLLLDVGIVEGRVRGVTSYGSPSGVRRLPQRTARFSERLRRWLLQALYLNISIHNNNLKRKPP